MCLSCACSIFIFMVCCAIFLGLLSFFGCLISVSYIHHYTYFVVPYRFHISHIHHHTVTIVSLRIHTLCPLTGAYLHHPFVAYSGVLPPHSKLRTHADTALYTLRTHTDAALYTLRTHTDTALYTHDPISHVEMLCLSL